MSLLQPWASLCFRINPATGRPWKWIETRGRRGPWASAVGERIGIASSARPMRSALPCHGVADCFCPDEDGAGPLVWGFEIAEACSVHGAAVPLGELLGTVVVEAVVPIGGIHSFSTGLVEGSRDPEEVPWIDSDVIVHSHLGGPTLVIDRAGGRVEEITDQLPVGEWGDGRWGLLLAEPRRLLEPLPVKGMLGLWTLPEHLNHQVERGTVELSPRELGA